MKKLSPVQKLPLKIKMKIWKSWFKKAFDSEKFKKRFTWIGSRGGIGLDYFKASATLIQKKYSVRRFHLIQENIVTLLQMFKKS